MLSFIQFSFVVLELFVSIFDNKETSPGISKSIDNIIYLA